MLAVKIPQSRFEKVSGLLQSYQITDKKLQSYLDTGNHDQVLDRLEKIAERLATDINVMSKTPVHKDVMLETNRSGTPQRVKLNIVQEAIRHLKETGRAEHRLGNR